MKALEENPRVVFHHHCHRMDIESEPNLILEKRLEYKLHFCWLEFHSVVQKKYFQKKATQQCNTHWEFIGCSDSSGGYVSNDSPKNESSTATSVFYP